MRAAMLIQGSALRREARRRGGADGQRGGCPVGPPPSRRGVRRVPMDRRTSREAVTFARPFTLHGIDGEQPAGTYPVETDEELVPGLSFLAWRRGATVRFRPSRPAA